MKIVRYSIEGKPTRYGIIDGKTIQPIEGKPFGKIAPAGEKVKLADVRLLAPCTPSKIVALGVNYKAHASEMSEKLPEEPLIFLKPSTAIIGPEDQIMFHNYLTRVDFEAELAVVIRKKAWRVAKEDWQNYVLGYTCLNDVTARDLQKKDGQWARAKGFDTFAPMGPWIETELDPSDLKIECLLNGEVKQSSTTKMLIFDVPTLVSFCSHVMTLLPGDVISTGTPSGIGPMQPGDNVEVRIQGIGSLKNRVIKG